MPFYHPNRRKVYGSQQVPQGYETITTSEYAQRFNYSTNNVARKCRRRKLTAYKSGGDWVIVVPIERS